MRINPPIRIGITSVRPQCAFSTAFVSLVSLASLLSFELVLLSLEDSSLARFLRLLSADCGGGKTGSIVSSLLSRI